MEASSTISLWSDRPQWEWPTGKISPGLYWWKDILTRSPGDDQRVGIAMMRANASATGLECDGWLSLEQATEKKGRIFVSGYVDLKDGEVGNGQLKVMGGDGDYDGHSGTVELTRENPKRYVIPL